MYTEDKINKKFNLIVERYGAQTKVLNGWTFLQFFYN